MDNQDKSTFSLDDEEIVEEEVIDRDEEYEDDDGYDDEYEEDYDDGEYDEEENYDDEEYDDGYNDDYYDDRLNKVLDEIAELKRGMVPANVQQQQPMAPPPIIPPQYIYQPSAPPAGSEVVMYNEISRLRDELAKNQSNLEMQKELSRLKEDMARDQKFAESQYNAEIKRLQDKIEDLLKNGSGPQGELSAPQEQTHIEGGNKPVLDLDKLLSINEAILRATRESDSRLQNEIGQIKKQLEDVPSLKEINNAISAVKKAANNADGVSAETLNKLSEDIAALRTAIDDKGAVQQVAVSPAPAVAVSSANGDFNAGELLRQLYDIKSVLGSSSTATVKRTQVLSDLLSDYKKVVFDVHSQSVSEKDKLVSLYDLVKKLSECNEPDAIDIVCAVNALIAEFSAGRLVRENFAEIANYCSESGISNISSAQRDSAERFFNICDKLAEVQPESYGDYLPDLVAEKNKLEDNRKEAHNNEIVGNITNELLNEQRDDDAVKEMLAELTDLTVADVFALPQVEMPKAYKPSRSVSDENIFDKLSELKTAVLDGIKSIETQQQVQPDAESEEDRPEVQQEEVRQAEVQKPEDDNKSAEILAAVEELKAALGAKTESNDISSALEDIRGNYLELTSRIVEISESIQNLPVQPTPIQTEKQEQSAVVDNSESIQQTLDDLNYIRVKLDEQGELISHIDGLREDILNIGSTINIAEPLREQLGSLIGEINTQFDKLYEDISNIVIESEANIINHLPADGGGSTEAIDNAKTDILADTQAIKDSLVSVSDMILADTQAIKDSLLANAQPGDDESVLVAVDQLRADVEAFIDQAAVNTEAATLDRQRILDDISFLREQAELAISENEQAADSETDGVVEHEDYDKLAAYLDDILAQVALLVNISEDVAVSRDSIAGISENIGAIADGVNMTVENVNTVAANVNTAVDTVNTVAANINAVVDTVNTVADSVNAVADNVNNIGDTVRPIAEEVISARDAAVAALDALTPISDQLNAILDRLDSAAEASVGDEGAQSEIEQTESFDNQDLIEIKESLNSILDTLPLFPQADDVVTARDNTYSILDSLALMPQSDDVIVTRDNVAAVLDAVNALSESVESAVSGANVGQLADDIAGVRDIIGITADDVKYIRQKMEEAPQSDEQVEDLANIMQDIGLILDKIEDYERTSAANKQEIIDAVGGIREEMHINTLDENMSAAGLDGETRDALIGEIAEIRERLVNIESATQSANDMNVVTLEDITARLAELQAAMEERAIAAEGDPAVAEFDNENMQAIIDELSAIKEKLDAQSEYDTVEEILSLREDIKAARIVDQDEVSGELEAIKNELAAISSGNILDEIRALREDVINLPNGSGDSAPTDGEINLVLNEIVSLRDEVFAFKDEVLNATAVPETQSEPNAPAESSDDVNAILDELSALRTDQTVINENIDELKDLISRRTTVGAAEGEDQAAAATIGGLDVVLDEIINLKNDVDRIEESVGGDRLNAISEQVDEIRAIIDELRLTENVGEEQSDAEQSVAVDLTPIMEQFDAVNAAINDLRFERETSEMNADGAVGYSVAERFDELRAEMEEIKAAVSVIAPVDYAAEIEELRAEVQALREENAQLKQTGTEDIGSQIAELKELIRDMAYATPAVSAEGDTSYAALIDEIRGLREQVELAHSEAPVVSTGLDEETLQSLRDAISANSDIGLSGELSEIRDEIAQLRSLTTVSAESGGAAEVAAMRDELAEIKSLISSSDSLYGVAEDVTAIKADVQTLKEEPDLGVMSEILALRDEFQALREQIEDVKRIAGETDHAADESLLNEVQSLRDQLFAISMANVNDPASGESNYESYNNIILDELAALRDQVSTAGSASDLAAIIDEFDELKARMDKREQQYDILAERVAKLGNDTADARILEELANLRNDMANQRDADLTTLNFMSEMAHLVERQNQYLTQNSGVKLSDEIESLKAEIASSDAVAEEVAKLREIMTQSGNSADNDSILNELADLREELSAQKPSRENALILDAIARLRDEVTVLAEREKVRDAKSDEDLSDSLSELKSQLNEIAGIVEPEEKKPAPRASTGGAKRGRKPGSKSTSTTKKSTSGTGAKRGRKPGTKNKKSETPAPATVYADTYTEPPTIDLDAVISEQASNLAGAGEMSLNPDAPNTIDAMAVADKLAKQVANKLIMEQLVEQLGDGGVSEERVDEILRDILPQEFTTIAETESSDKIRRLANRLVLDKLRSRLNGNNNDDNE